MTLVAGGRQTALVQLAGRLASITFAMASLAFFPGNSLAAPEAMADGLVGIAVELFGLAPYPISSQGLRLGYRFPQGYEVETAYVRSRKSMLLTDFRYRECEVRARLFAGDFAYWGAGLGYREVDLEYGVFTDGSETSVELSERHRALTAHLHMGFEWTLLGFLTAGSDVFNVSLPLRWLNNDDRYPADAAGFEDDPKDLPHFKDAFGTNLHFLRTYLKVRF